MTGNHGRATCSWLAVGRVCFGVASMRARRSARSATLGVDYLIIGASQRTAMAKLLGGSVVTSVAQQLPDSIRLVIFG